MPARITPVRPAETFVLEMLADRCHAHRKSHPVLRHLAIELTSRCNLRCRHCCVRAGPDRGDDDLNLAELLGLGLSIRRDFGRRVAIDFLGGEPLLRTDLLPILRFYATLGFPLTLATNGTLLDPTSVWRLSRYLSALCVSLDGVRDSHALLRGRRDVRRLVRALRHAVKSPIPLVEVKTAVWKGNLGDLPVLHEIVRKLHVDSWHVFPVEAMGRGEEIEAALLDQDDYRRFVDFCERVRERGRVPMRFCELSSIHRRLGADAAERLSRCSAGISSAGVRSDGGVVACLQERGPAQGDVRTDSLREIWDRGFAVNRSACWTRCGRHRFPE